MVPLIGATYSLLSSISKKYPIENGFKARYRLSAAVSLVLEPFRKLEDLITQNRINSFKPADDPVFIIGHWRSGTTYLHNLLSRDKQFGYCSTYQSVLPKLTLSNQWWLSYFIKLIMPSHRPADNVELNLAFPQEEEFALGNLTQWCFYYAWYFPKHFSELVEEHIERKSDDKEYINQWKKIYTRFISIALLNTNGKIYLSKNPPNTMRLDLLTELFPNARFIYISRNPYEVFESSKRFIKGVMPTTQLQSYDQTCLDTALPSMMQKFFSRYEHTKALIKPGRIMEITYESLLKNPKDNLESIYKTLELTGFETASKSFQEFTNKGKQHTVHNYTFKPETIKLINAIWSNSFERMGYQKL